MRLAFPLLQMVEHLTTRIRRPHDEPSAYRHRKTERTSPAIFVIRPTRVPEGERNSATATSNDKVSNAPAMGRFSQYV
jgi:hypothetical protein